LADSQLYLGLLNINDLSPPAARRSACGAAAPLSDGAAADEAAPLSSWRRLMIDDLSPPAARRGACAAAAPLSDGAASAEAAPLSS